MCGVQLESLSEPERKKKEESKTEGPATKKERKEQDGNDKGERVEKGRKRENTVTKGEREHRADQTKANLGRTE